MNKPPRLRLAAGALLASLALAAALPIRANPAPSPSISVYAETYFPDDDVHRDIRFESLSLELEHRFRRSALQPLSVGLLASVHRSEGTSIRQSDSLHQTFDARSTGLSLSAFVRLTTVRTETFALYMDMAAGGVWTDEAWPPGGTTSNGIFRYGLGLTYAVTPEWSLLAGFRYLHVSNGGGLNDDNPAYDALGGYVGFARPLGGSRRAESIVPPPVQDKSRARVGTDLEYFVSRDEAFQDIAIQAATAFYERRLARLPQLALTGAGSFYYVSGESPASGLGAFNAGSVGQSLNLGARWYLLSSGRVEWFVEASVGGVIHFTRSWPIGDANEPSHTFTNPASWMPAYRLGTGLNVALTDDTSLSFGYRQLHLDNYDSPKRPNYVGGGLFLGVNQRW